MRTSFDFYHPTPARRARPRMSLTPAQAHALAGSRLRTLSLIPLVLDPPLGLQPFPVLLYPSDSKPRRLLRPRTCCRALEKLYILWFQYDHRTFCIRRQAVVSLA